MAQLVKGMEEAGLEKSGREVTRLVQLFGEEQTREINYTDFLAATIDVKRHISRE